MTIPALWSEVLNALQLQMTKATFEAWLKNTTAQEEDGRLIIFAPNNYAQDWLDNRLRHSIEHTVAIVAGEVMEIEFRVAESLAGYQPELIFTGTYRDAYNAITQPDEIHYTSKYFHQKWLPLLGPDMWLLIWEMRTRCYRNKKTGVVRDTFESTYLELAAATGMGERTVWGLLHPKDPLKKTYLDKFIISSKTKRRYSQKRGSSVNEKTEWQIRLDDPLTPEDEIKLEQMLSTNGQS